MARSLERWKLKDKIIDHVSRSIKQIQACHLSREDDSELRNGDWQIQDFLKYMDHALLHGLKHVTKGYWVVVKEFTRRESVIHLQRLTDVTTYQGRGRSWLYLALNEGLLESYMRCFRDNMKIVRRFYVKDALVMDMERLGILTILVSGLDCVAFKLDIDVAYLDVSCHLTLKDGKDSDSDKWSLNSITSTISEIADIDTRPTRSYSVIQDSSDASPFVRTRSSSTSTTTPSAFLPSITENQNVTNTPPEEKISGSFTPFIADQVNSWSPSDEQAYDDLVIHVKSKATTRNRKKKTTKKKLGDAIEVVEDRVDNGSAVCQLDLIHTQTDMSIENEVWGNMLKNTEMQGNEQCVPPPIEKNELDAKVTKEFLIKDEVDDVSVELENDKVQQSVWQTIIQQTKENPASLADELAQAMTTTSQAPGPAADDIDAKSGRSSTESSQDFRTTTDIQVQDVIMSLEKPKKSCDKISTFEDLENVQIQENARTKTLKLGKKDRSDSLEEKSAIQKESSKLNTCSDNVDQDIYSSETKADESDITFEEEVLKPMGTNTNNVVENEALEALNSTQEELIDVEVKVDNNTLLHLMLETFQSEDEKYVKMYKSCMGHTEGEVQNVFVLLTNCALYILSKGAWGSMYTRESVITYHEIDYISLSINYQVVQIVCTNRRKQLWLSTGNEVITRAITSTLNKLMTESDSKLSVLTDATTQKISIKKWAATECGCQINEVDLKVYSLVYWEDPVVSASRGVTKEGELKFRYKTQYKTSTWRLGYFVLKDGTLFQYSDRSDNKVPNHTIQLFGEDCSGCRRYSSSDLPHSLEIIYSNGASLQLAAKDMTECNDWLLSMCKAVSEGQKVPPSSISTLPCCVAVTQSKVLLCHEDLQANFFRTLGSATITDVTGVTIDPGTDTYCILEFESSDEHVSSNQWVLYFYSALEREKFLNPLAELWCQKFQIPVPINLIDNVPLQKKCRTMAASIK